MNDDDDDDDECGAVEGMIGKGIRSIRRSAPVPLCPTEIPNSLTLAIPRAAAVRSQRLRASAVSTTLQNRF
jgi:hypothetical protein